MPGAVSSYVEGDVEPSVTLSIIVLQTFADLEPRMFILV